MGWVLLIIMVAALAGIVFAVVDLVTDPPAGGWRNIFRRW